MGGEDDERVRRLFLMTPSITRVLAAATVTLAFLGPALLPRALFADGAAGRTKPLTRAGVQVGDLLVAGRLVEDRTTSSGWAIELRVENTGAARREVALETDLTRAVFNPGNRVTPEARSIWGFKDEVKLDAGQHVRRRYVLPMDMATRLTANAAGFDRGGFATNPMTNRPEQITTQYALRIRCPGFDDIDINPS